MYISRFVPALLVVLSIALSAPSAAHAQAEFIRGDVNHDGRVTISDAETFNCIFFCGFWPWLCQDAADVDDNGTIDLSDLVRLLQALFQETDPQFRIPAPFPEPGLDPTEDDLGCGEYEITPPEEFDDAVALGHVRAAPGQLVQIPVRVTSEERVMGLQLAVRYDSSLFAPIDLDTLEGHDRSRLSLEGTVNDDDLPFTFLSTRVFPEDSVFRFAFEMGLVHLNGVEPGENVHVVNLLGRVAEDAAWGAVVTFELVEHAADDGTVVGAELSGEWQARIPRQLVSGTMTVAEAFIRGDGNVDGQIDVSDAIHILNRLFVGGVVIDCLDSADTNDDSSVDLSDGLSILNHLFLGGDAPVAPYPSCGVDESEDSLDCVSYPPCH